jgi:spermidine/putrescine transport system permease protein
MIVFALSIDDFVTSQFLARGQESKTVPMLIYATGRTEPNPSLNAVATLMLLVSLTAVAVAFLGMRALSRRQGIEGRPLTRLDLGPAEAS